MEALLGKSLVVAASGKEFATADLKQQEAVALMFSASWCGPCKQFLRSVLKDAYVNNLKAKGLEIVFISADRDQASFDSYAKEMPWLALPFSDREREAALSKKYKIRGIPTIIIVDAKTGETITADGRSAIAEDPKGVQFPYRPKSIKEIFSKAAIQSKDGKDVDKQFADVEAVGIYFSAHWCPPCRQFTPILGDAYNEINKGKKKLEIVFVSSDRDEASYKEYRSQMPFASLKYDQRDLKSDLSKLFGVEGIPTLVLLDPKNDFKTITQDGVSAIYSDKGNAFANFPFLPKPVNVLSDLVVESLQENPSVLMFCGTEQNAQATAASLTAVVETFKGEAEVCDPNTGMCVLHGEKIEGVETWNFITCGDHPLVGRIRSFFSPNEAKQATLVFVDFSSGEFYPSKLSGGEKVTPQQLKEFVKEALVAKKIPLGKPS